jgi:hypothetical protein
VGILAYIGRLFSPLGGIEKQFVALDVHPHHGDLRVSASVECNNVTIRLVFKHLFQGRGDVDCHRSTPFLMLYVLHHCLKTGRTEATLFRQKTIVCLGSLRQTPANG